MTVSYVAYDLNNGFIMNWLVGGPQVFQLDQPADFTQPEIKKQIAAQYYETKQNISNMPVEPGPLNESAFTVGSYTGEWSYFRCGEDSFVEISAVYPTPVFARAWAYTQLVSEADQVVSFDLTTYGPVDIWLNRKNIFHYDDSSAQPATRQFSIEIAKGSNKIFVRFAGVAAPEVSLAYSLKASGDGLSVQIPTNIPSLPRREELENIAQAVYLDRDIYTSDHNAYLQWPEGPEKATYNDVRFQHVSGRIYAQAEDVGKPGQKLFMGEPVNLREGPYQAFIMPRAWEYYDSNIRVTHHINAWVMGRNKFSSAPYGTPESRKKEALYNAAMREGDLFGDFARMAMGRWGELDENTLNQAFENITQRAYGSEMQLLGLLGAVSRYQDQEEFPAWLKEKVAAGAASFRYSAGEAGCDGLRFDDEDRLIAFYACEILAGQLNPETVFTHSQLSGAQHRERAEAKVTAWMRERGKHGFAAWNSKADYAATLISLSYLIDLAEKEDVWELASVLLDKLLFSIAVNSVHGVFGVTQGNASTSNIKSALLEEISGITRLLWGIGVFNVHTAGAVSFALLENYELPLILAEIAANQTDEIWNLEQQDLGEYPVNTAAYRTPSYLLSSAQDYRPGQKGSREQIWQASLSPQSVVFVNHPGGSSEVDVRTPNYWLGNGVLPRVAQWKDTLIALYNLPEDDRMGFTHAYFPTIEFDEFVIRDNTAFGRKDSGYIALTAPQGLVMLDKGHTAFRELRSYGKETVWICQMGQQETDGSFEQFQEKVLSLEIKVEGLKVSCPTLRGDLLQFGWSDAFLRSGEIVALAGYKHFDNPFSNAVLPCSEMEIRTENFILTLDFKDMV